MVFERQGGQSVHLPPRDLWIYDPTIYEALETPLDERGLVDLVALISLMKATVAPGYDWSSTFIDEHHVQWPDRAYMHSDDVAESPHTFRNLAISKVRVPRVFHNWVHRITEPPKMPSAEVMQYRIEAQRVAISLYQQVKNAKTMARHTGLDDEELEQSLMGRFDQFAESFEIAKQTPPEFQLLDYRRYELNTTHDMVRIGTKLGRFAVTASATRRVRQLEVA